jgi:hypothetical protein
MLGEPLYVLTKAVINARIHRPTKCYLRVSEQVVCTPQPPTYPTLRSLISFPNGKLRYPPMSMPLRRNARLPTEHTPLPANHVYCGVKVLVTGPEYDVRLSKEAPQQCFWGLRAESSRERVVVYRVISVGVMFLEHAHRR